MKRFKISKKQSDFNYIYKNELDKAYFGYDVAHDDSKDLIKRSVSDKDFKFRVYKIALNPKYDEYQIGLASMVYRFFDKKVGSRAITTGKAKEKRIKG